MSGRLVILHKKSYCPWKAENVERVLRDERLEAERLERENGIVAKHESELRSLARLRGQPPTNEPVPQHVNLFQDEEEKNLKEVVGETEKKTFVAGIMPVALGQTELKTRGDKRPFYLRDAEEVKKLSPTETKRKYSLDPMRKFNKRHRERREPKKPESSSACSDDDDEKRRRKKQRRRQGRDSSKKSGQSKKKDDMKELRRRRQEREANESIRASALLGNSNDDRNHSNQKQYKPGAIRR